MQSTLAEAVEIGQLLVGVEAKIVIIINCKLLSINHNELQQRGRRHVYDRDGLASTEKKRASDILAVTVRFAHFWCKSAVA
ncbi:hypothetical protein TrispH2_008610 [Trichoplax sp. H2]|nr:hypothetical protein TrispH2_008610 [Trichoplax sp. H2]|eukprot:RDD38994.1 hypothetical protein TrispH2_008610 [Trichoplax sp. H2]